MNARRMLLPWAAVALAAAPLAAQVPADAGIFRLYQGTAEIGRETFLDTGTTRTTTVTIPLLGIRLASEAVRDATGRGLRLTTRVFHLPADTLVRTYTAAVDGDSLRMSQQDQGSPSEYASLTETSVGADVLDTLATWLKARLATGATRP